MSRALIAVQVAALVAGSFALSACKEKPAEKAATPGAATASPTVAAPDAAPPPPAAPKERGTIKGSVAFTGTAPKMEPVNMSADPVCAKSNTVDNSVLVNDNKTLKNALVRIASAVPGSWEAPATKARLVQKGCTYDPRVQAIVSGQTLEVVNGDPTFHNVHTYKGTITLFNEAHLPGAPPFDKVIKDDRALIKFKCDVHPWMTGWLSITSHPFFQVTGDDGSFELAGVPAGTYTVEAWHEKYGTKTAEVTVAADKAVEAKFSFDGTEKP